MADSPVRRMRSRSRRTRERSLRLATDARRRLTAAPRAAAAERRGRLWLNGRELGAPDGRFAHLTGSYD